MPIQSLNQMRGLSASDRTQEDKQAIQEQMGYVSTNSDDITLEAFKQKFQNDGDFQELMTGLDAKGMRDLLSNEEYVGTVERNRRLQEGNRKAQSVTEGHQASLNNPFVPAYARGAIALDAARRQISPSLQYKEEGERDKEIREGLFAQTQKRRENKSRGLADSVYNAFIEADNSGDRSLAETYAEFDNFANNKDVSPHYATFRNTKWLKRYTEAERLKDYAMYQALAAQYGETAARQYLDRTIQNRVAKAQDGEWTGNTLKKIGNTIVSDLGSNIGMMSYIGKSSEEIGLLNQGLDPNKPLYNEKGELVGYEPNNNIWTNPAYWSDVYKYNTTDPEQIRIIKERGGISENVNVKEYGHTPTFWSWETAQEAAAQSGHIAAFGIETGLTGGFGKLVGVPLKAGMKAIGVSGKALSAMNKAGNITNDLFVAFASSASAAQQEAMGAFDEELQTHKEKIEEQKRHELQDYYQTIDYTTPEAQEAVAGYYDQLKRQDTRRVAQRVEGTTILPQSDEALVEKAKQLYANDLLQAKSEELDELHKKDEIEASKAAAIGYGTTFMMDWVKEAPFSMLLQKFKFAKGSQSGVLDNTIRDNIIGDAVTGGIKRAGKKLTSAKKLAKEYGKLIGGGFVDEWLDGVNASFAEGVSNNEFSNYIDRTYNPEAYNEATDNLLGNMLSGMVSGIKGTVDSQNIYEGSIGLLSPMGSAMVNVNAVFHPKDTWRGVVQGIDGNGNKLNWAERASKVLMNPLLNTYADLKEKDRTIDNVVETVNNVVSKNKDKLENAAELINALNRNDSPLQFYSYTNEDEEEGVSNLPSMLDAKDEKLQNAFTLINTLNTLSSIQGAENSSLYQDAVHTIEGLAGGSLSEDELNEEIDSFLADDDNKSILEMPNNREIAAERLQKNAQYFQKMRQRVQEVSTLFANSPSMKNVDPRVKTILTYGIVASDDYAERLKEMEESLGVSATNTEGLYTPDFSVRYGTTKAKERAVAARDRILADNKKKQVSIEEEIKKTGADIERLQGKARKDADAEQQVKQLETLKKSQQFQLANLKEQQRLIEDEKYALETLLKDGSEVQLTEEAIMSMDARDRAEVLNPQNAGNYSKEQQKVINHVRKKLLKNNPEAMMQVRDASILAGRIADLATVHEKLLQDDELAAVYLNAVEQNRTKAAMAESLQQGIEERYGKIERAYENRFIKRPRQVERRQTEFKNAVLASSMKVIEAYMEDHPEQAEQIKPYYDMLKFSEDAAAVIADNETDPLRKVVLLETLFRTMQASENRENLESALEQMIADNEGTPIADDMENLLSKMEQLGYQRNATVIENRKQRKEREEAQRKAEDERKKQLEAAVKEAEEKAKQKTEEKARAQAEIDKDGTKEDRKNLATAEEVNLGIDSFEGVEGGNLFGGVEEAEPEGKSSSIVADEVTGVQQPVAEDKETKKSSTDQNNSSDSSVNNIMEVHDEALGDVIQGKSPSLEEQMTEAQREGQGEVQDVNSLPNSDKENSRGEKEMETSSTTLNGVSMNEWVVNKDFENAKHAKNGSPVRYDKDLSHDHVLVHKKGGKEGDKMNQFYDWLRNAGSKLQNITDDELPQILAQNPHVPVKFMRLKPDGKVGSFRDNLLMLVIDYTDGVAKVHNDENGGVITSNGKKYLVIGEVGYGDEKKNPDKFNLWKMLMDIGRTHELKKKAWDWFQQDVHKHELYYVHEGFHTEVVPNSMIPGYIIRQNETDESEQERSISELLNDEERNPHGYKLENLGWAIQNMTSFWTANTRGRAVMSPEHAIDNIGRVFVLVPAGNGKLLPAKIEPLHYADGMDENGNVVNPNALNRDSVLWKRIQGLFNQLTSPKYEDRRDAIGQLSTLLYFAPKEQGNKTILIGTDEHDNRVTVVNGEQRTTFFLDSNFNREDFFRAIREMNPRINVTPGALTNKERLKELDEIGALKTDIAKLGTSGVSYSIYGVDESGNMIVPEKAATARPEESSGNSESNIREFRYLYNANYKYNMATGEFTKDGVPVTGDDMIEYAYKIGTQQVASVKQEGVWQYYIISTGENPEVVRQNNVGRIEKLSTEEAQKVIDEEVARVAEERRKMVLEQALAEQQKSAVQEAEPTVDENGDLSFFEEGDNTEAKKEIEMEQTAKPQPSTVPSVPVEKVTVQEGTRTFKQLWRSSDRNKVLDILKQKDWESIPMEDMTKLKKYLEDKGMKNLDMIGTSEADFEAWLDKLRCL